MPPRNKHFLQIEALLRGWQTHKTGLGTGCRPQSQWNKLQRISFTKSPFFPKLNQSSTEKHLETSALCPRLRSCSISCFWNWAKQIEIVCDFSWKLNSLEMCWVQSRNRKSMKDQENHLLLGKLWFSWISREELQWKIYNIVKCVGQYLSCRRYSHTILTFVIVNPPHIHS